MSALETWHQVYIIDKLDSWFELIYSNLFLLDNFDSRCNENKIDFGNGWY